jgi:hypothetical protein
MCFYTASEFINKLLVLRHQCGHFHNDHFILFDFHFKFNHDNYGNHYFNILELHQFTVHYDYNDFVFNIGHWNNNQLGH